MKRKGVWSQGDFGVDKTDKKLADFLLSRKEELKNFMSSHVVDLSHKQPGISLLFEEKIKQKRGRKKKLVEKSAVRQPIKPMELFKKFSTNWPRFVEPLEVSRPERDQILARLEEIEAVDNSLKEISWRIKAESAAMDPPEVADLEKYLWLEEKISSVSEPDILAELLAEPDLEAIDLSVGIESNPVSSSFNLTPKSSLAPKERGGIMLDDQGELILPDRQDESSDFLARWRQKKDKSDKVALIPASRKFWDKKKSGVAEPGRVKFFTPWRIATRQLAGFLSVGALIYLVIFGMSLAGRGLAAKETSCLPK